MKISVLIIACGFCLAAAPLFAQTSASTPTTVHPDSPARANPRASTPKRPVNGDDGARIPRGPLDWERTVALSPDGRLFVTRSLDRRLRVWDLSSGRSEIELPAEAIEAVFSPDSRLLACHLPSPARDSPARAYWQIFTVAGGKPAGGPLVGANPDGATSLQSVCFSPDGRWLAEIDTVLAAPATNATDPSGNQKSRVMLWDLASGKLAATQPVNEISYGNTLIFSPDGRTLAALGSGVVLLNVPDLKLSRFIDLKTPAGTPAIETAAFSPDGKLLGIGGDGHRALGGSPAAFLYETVTGRLLTQLKFTDRRNGPVRQVVFADGGRAMITATEQSTLAWTVDGKLLANLIGAVYPVAVSADGKTLAGWQPPVLAFWETSAWRLGLRIQGTGTGDGKTNDWNPGIFGPFVLSNSSIDQPPPVPLVFTPDGTGVAALRGNSAAVWDLASGKLRAECKATQVRP